MRHRWGDPARYPLKTERVCLRCGLIRVTRHDAGPTAVPWVEFWNGDGRVETPATPKCEGIK